jgi:hypothetical protein
MEYNLKNNAVGVLSTVLDSVSEQPVDIDFTLPDYCPDIEKILRCRIIPKIYNKNLSGGQLQIDGTTVVNILYTDSKNNVRACEQSIPFNASFAVKEIPDNAVVETSVKCEYVNCRPLSQRRISVHGAFSLYAKVYTKGKISLFSPDYDSGIEYDTKEITASSLSSLCQEQFSAGDEIQIVNKPPVEIVLDSGVRAVITDYKVIPNKLVFNGELNVRLLYLSNADSSTVNQIDYSIPFTKTVDCDGLDESTKASINISVLSYDVRLKSDILSENPVVNIDSRLCATVTGYKNEEVTVICDAYSTDYILELEKIRITFPCDAEVLEDSFMLKDAVSVADCDIEEIIDFNVNYSLNNFAINNDNIILNSKLNVSILALNSEKEPEYIERSLEFDKEIKNSGFNNISSAFAHINSVSYRIADNSTIELRCEIKYSLTAEKNCSYTLVSSISADEDNKTQKREDALVLYFAEDGEKIWDIAKRYNTRKNLIVDENALESDILEKAQMLLIPMV